MPNGTYNVKAKFDTGPFKLDKKHKNEFIIRR